MIRVLLAGVQPTGLADALAADALLSVVAQIRVADLTAGVHRHAPDVVALSLDGRRDLAAVCDEIERLMGAAPRPLLALRRAEDVAVADRCRAAGALEVLPADTPADAVARRLRLLSGVPVVTRRGGAQTPSAPQYGAGRVVGLVASTGGPPALARVLADLEGDAPVLVVQHIDAGFVDGFADWLTTATGRACRLAADGERVRQGTVYVAPPHHHLCLAAGARVELRAEPASLHRPSGDVLLESLARHAGVRAVAAVLTGMGEDGAQGLLAVRRAGGVTFAQDEATCAVFGMPRAAARLGAAQRVVSLDRMGRALSAALQPSGLAPRTAAAGAPVAEALR